MGFQLQWLAFTYKSVPPTVLLWNCTNPLTDSITNPLTNNTLITLTDFKHYFADFTAH